MKTNPPLQSHSHFYRVLACLPVAALVLLLGCPARAGSPGDLDASFNPGTGADWRVLGIARQADGKLVVGGQFNTFNDQKRNRITRLNENGSTDFTFNAGDGADSSVNAVAIAPDGKILVGGDFYSFNGFMRYRLVRLNATGSVDTSFALVPGADGPVQAVAVQADGKVLIAGGFSAVNGTARSRVARLNTDGSLDASFNPGSGPNGPVLTIALQPDGKILIGGYFASVNGTTRNRVARLNNDGTLDPAFVPGTLDNGYVNSVSLTADGKVFIAGGISVGLQSRILRLLANGAVDNTFSPGNNAISSDVTIAIAQSDGKVLIGGYFESVTGVSRNGLARLNPDGTLDPAFNPGVGANQLVWTLLLQPDGRLVAGGAFTSYAGVSRNRITRIHNDAVQVNQAPLMAALGSLTVLEDAGLQNVNVTGIAPGPAGEAAQTVTNLAATSSNPAIIPHPSVTYTPGATTATLAFTPVANANGVVTISVVAQDNGGTAFGGVDRTTNTFTVTVTPVNDAPSFTLAPAGTVVAWFTDTYLDMGQATVPPAALNGVTAVAGGWYHSLALKTDGSVVAWGDNWRGATNVPVAAQSGVVAVAAGNSFSLALKSDGTVVAWGNNDNQETDVPPGLANVAAIAAGENHSLALRNDGTVVAWGRNNQGQTNVPVGLTGVVAIAAGSGNSLAVKSDGTVVGWGMDWGRFTGVNDLVAIDAFDERALGLKRDGTLAEHGYYGLGDGSVSNVTAIAAGADHALALRSDGTVLAFNGGEIPLAAQRGVMAISAGESHSLAVVRGVSPALVVREDSGAQLVEGALNSISPGPADESSQAVFFTVTNDNNALFLVQPGISTVGTLTFTPAPNANGSANVTVIARDNGGLPGVDASAPQTFTLTVTAVNDAPTTTFATNNHVVLEDSGAASVAGFATLNVGPADESGQSITNFAVSNNNNALFSSQPGIAPDGTLTFTPALNAYGSATVTVIVGDDGGTANGGVNRATNSFTITVAPVNDAPGFTLNLGATLVGWGRNDFNQTVAPVEAQGGIVAIAGGGTHTLVLKNDGRVVAWGDNFFGQSSVPAAAQSGVSAISTHGHHSLVIKTDGSVVAWGLNDRGQTDVPATATSGVTAIAAGFYHSVVLENDGSVLAWGGNADGQTTIPAAAQSGVIAIAAGWYHTLALKTDGSVVAWGGNSWGQTTIPLAAQSGVIAISAGVAHSMALKSDGSVVVWGYTAFGITTVPAAAQSGVIAIAAGGYHNLALKDDGTVVAWGRSDDGRTTVPAGAASGVAAIAAGGDHSLALVGTNRLTVAEDSGVQIIPAGIVSISPGPANESSQVVSFIVANNNNLLFSSQPAFNTAGTLTYTPAPNANGSATVTVYAQDNGGTDNGGVDTSAPQNFAITVTPVNDAPSFNLSSTNLMVFPGDGAVSQSNWATNVSVGPADESAQALAFTVTNGNNALFTVQPALSPGGTLTFTPVPDASGMVTLGVRAVDNGGTANGGADTSGWQTFTITFATVKVFVSESPTVIAGTAVEVPISLAGIGDEGGVSFTITYDRPRLVFQSVAVEPGSGLTLTWTEPYGGMMNTVGIIVTKPAGSNFPAGTNVMVRLTFQAPIGTAPTNTPISFNSAVIMQQVSDTNANVIPNVSYVPGSVAITAVPPLEGDVAPRNASGNGAVTVSDAVQLTRFVAGWDAITDFTANGEFQRADCAPRGTLGDGRVTLIDLVQTLRYAAGLDPATPAGGPTMQAAALAASSPPLAAGSRVVRVAGGNLLAGRANNVSVRLDAQGNEAGVSLSLNFDPTALAFVSATVGSGASGGSLAVNDLKAAAGRVGLVLVMPAGTGIAAGSRDIITLVFNVASVTGNTAISVSGDTPVRREVADLSANTLGASFVDGSFNLILPPGLKATGLERAADGSLHLVVANRDGTPVTAAQAARYEVHVTSDLGGAWSLLPDALMIENGALKIVDPLARSAGLRLYKLVELP